MVVGGRQLLGRSVSAGCRLAVSCTVVFAAVSVVSRRGSEARGKLAASVSATATPVSGPASIAIVVLVSASHVGTGTSVCGTSVGRPRRAPVVWSTMVDSAVRGVCGTGVSARAAEARTAMRGTSVGTSMGDASVSEVSVAGTRVCARTAVRGTGVRPSVGDACVSEVTVGGTGVRTMVSDTCVPEITMGRTRVRTRTTKVWTTVSGSGVGASVSDAGVPVGRTSVARMGVSGSRAVIRTAVCRATVSRAGVTKTSMGNFVGRSRVSRTVVRRTRMCSAGSSSERAGRCGSGVAHGRRRAELTRRRPVYYARCAVLGLRGTKDTSGNASGRASALRSYVELRVQMVEPWRVFAFKVVPPVANEELLVKNSAVGAEERVVSAVFLADVEDLALCVHVTIVASILLVFAAEHSPRDGAVDRVILPGRASDGRPGLAIISVVLPVVVCAAANVLLAGVGASVRNSTMPGWRQRRYLRKAEAGGTGWLVRSTSRACSHAVWPSSWSSGRVPCEPVGWSNAWTSMGRSVRRSACGTVSTKTGSPWVIVRAWASRLDRLESRVGSGTIAKGRPRDSPRHRWSVSWSGSTVASVSSVAFVSAVSAVSSWGSRDFEWLEAVSRVITVSRGWDMSSVAAARISRRSRQISSIGGSMRPSGSVVWPSSVMQAWTIVRAGRVVGSASVVRDSRMVRTACVVDSAGMVGSSIVVRTACSVVRTACSVIKTTRVVRTSSMVRPSSVVGSPGEMRAACVVRTSGVMRASGVVRAPCLVEVSSMVGSSGMVRSASMMRPTGVVESTGVVRASRLVQASDMMGYSSMMRPACVVKASSVVRFSRLVEARGMVGPSCMMRTGCMIQAPSVVRASRVVESSVMVRPPSVVSATRVIGASGVVRAVSCVAVCVSVSVSLRTPVAVLPSGPVTSAVSSAVGSRKVTGCIIPHVAVVSRCRRSRARDLVEELVSPAVTAGQPPCTAVGDEGRSNYEED